MREQTEARTKALDTREVNRAVSDRINRPHLKTDMLLKLAADRVLNVANGVRR